MQTSARPYPSANAIARAAVQPTSARHLIRCLAIFTSASITLATAAHSQSSASAHAHGDQVCTELHEHAGSPESISAWLSRRPRAVTRLDEITNPALHEIVHRLRENATFQAILTRLEIDRCQRFRKEKRDHFRPDPAGVFVRETAVVVWMPGQRGPLGVYAQRSGGVFAHSNFARTGANAILRTPCDVELTGEAAFHIRIHTHPWGSVPSAHDLKAAQVGLVDFVVSEKGGVPTVYVFSARGSVWEVPTRLFRAENDVVTVASNAELTETRQR